jgi:hypothetical protein
MKTLRYILAVVISISTGCKKDKLSGDAISLVGHWTWFETSGEFTRLTPDNTSSKKTIQFKEKGKYEIEVDGKKKESGRITYEIPPGTSTQKHIKIKFLRNDLFSKKQEFIGNCVIWFSGSDTITISENVDWTHQDSHKFVRQN